VVATHVGAADPRRRPPVLTGRRRFLPPAVSSARLADRKAGDWRAASTLAGIMAHSHAVIGGPLYAGHCRAREPDARRLRNETRRRVDRAG
jgi:hypothetical protein